MISRVGVAALCLLATAHAATKSAGCGKALPAGIKTGGIGESNKVTFATSDGVKRNYLLHVPVGYSPNDTPHGLIFSFHGRTEDAVNQEKLSKFSDADINPEMFAVYPNGINKEWQGDPDASTDDVSFTLALLKSISADYCIDADRIYAAGKSNGGGFSANILACDPVASTKIAAFAGAAGAYYQGHNVDTCDGAMYPITCTPGRKPVPIIETHGEVDPVIPYNGGARRTRCLPSIPHFMTAWSDRNGLGRSNVSTVYSGGKYVKHEFGKDAGLQGINTHYWVKDLGHAWPDTTGNPDGCCSYINGSRLMIEFFNKWTLSGVPFVKVAEAASTSASSTSTSTTTTTLTTSTTISSTGTSKSSTTTTKSTAASSTTPKASAVSTSSSKSVASSTPTSTKTTSTTTSYNTSAYPSPSCPAADGTTWTSPNKNTFKILCGQDTRAYVLGVPIYNLNNFGLCIKACEDNKDCGHVTYNGACYLKKAQTGAIYSTGSNVNRVAIKQTK